MERQRVRKGDRDIEIETQMETHIYRKNERLGEIGREMERS